MVQGGHGGYKECDTCVWMSESKLLSFVILGAQYNSFLVKSVLDDWNLHNVLGCL